MAGVIMGAIKLWIAASAPATTEVSDSSVAQATAFRGILAPPPSMLGGAIAACVSC